MFSFSKRVTTPSELRQNLRDFKIPQGAASLALIVAPLQLMIASLALMVASIKLMIAS